MAGTGLPQVGDAFGRFRIVRLLGRGGMGAVYAADQVGLGREVALKVLLPEYADNEEFRSRFTHEATVLAGIDHPHVLHVYDHGEHESYLYLATQLVAGGDLSDHLISHGPLSPEEALAIAEQVADALSTAHERGVVHRDVKPGNVLLRRAPGTASGPESGSESGEAWAYLGDFGIASTGESVHTATGAVVGTWRYLSPERCRGEVATASGDIYSVGCLLWTMLTGTPPYEGTDVEVGMAHLQAPIPQLTGTDPGTEQINDLLRNSMAKLPEDRYPSAARLRTALRGARAALGNSGASRETAADDRDDFRWSTMPGRPKAPRLPLRPSDPGTDPQTDAETGRGRFGRRGAVLLVLAMIAVATLGVWFSQRDSTESNQDRTQQRVAREWEPVSCAASDTEDLRSCPTTVRGEVRLPTGDFDGDGFIDAAVLGTDPQGDTVIQTLLTRPETSTIETWATLDSHPELMVAGDVDADGRDDLVLLTAAPGGLDVNYLRSTRDGLAAPRLVGRLPARFAQQGKFALGDLDGDQHADLVAVGVPGTGIDVQVMRGSDRGMADPEVWTELSTWTWKNMKIAVGDVNGDGRDDLISMGRPPGGGTDLRVFPSTGSAFSRNQGWASIPDWSWDDARPTAGDFNGDGMVDVAIVHRTDDAPELGMYLSEGSRFGPRVLWDAGSPVTYVGSAVGAGDVNADGRDDLVMLRATGGGIAQDQHPSTGEGFGLAVVAQPPGWTWGGP